MDDLEDLFEDHRAYLVAGRKEELVHAIISMLYFEYPSSSSPVLHINKIMKTSASELRRLAREKQRLLEEEESRLENLKFWTLPIRSRYRVYCGSHRISRFLCTVSIFHYPHQARNFFIIATHPTSSTQFQLPLGLFYAAKAANINSLPHTWNAKVKTQVAQAVALQLRFVYNANGEMALSVSGRIGYYSKAIQFEEAQTPESIARTAHKQSVQNNIKELQQEFYEENSALENVKSAKEEEFNRELRLLEASRCELEERDEAVKAQLDEIESHGMNNLEGLDKEERHIQRQLVREKRAQVKKDRGETLAALKTVQMQITALLTKLQDLNANTNTSIKSRAIELDLQLNALQKQAETPPPYVDMCNGEKRYSAHYTRSRRPRAFLGMINQLVQGAATIQNAKVRYSVALLNDRRVEFAFYSPTASQYISFECSLATWSIFSKEGIKSKSDRHAMQTAIPHFIQHFGTEHEPSALLTELNTIETTIESKRAKNPIDYNHLTQLHRNRRVILRQAQKLYHHLVSALCERLEWHTEAITANEIIYSQNPYLLVADDEIERSGKCIVKLLPDHKLSFIVDLLSGEHYEEIHPYTKELVLELASESAQEMQVHLELIVSSMQLIHENDQTKLEFVD
ncbi:hypothetical protein THRCLA_22552 [Thraustotheca clavata]|uniref:Uncharacterized protein n=1 Tax=Thraustotheca clavata TaxID=74557 RepID=A0A1V9YX96_9STRA|nr:hypothetical protein THRCLA_22552 [Thraustotheca clavata]